MPFSSAVPQPHNEPSLSPYDDAVAGLREPFAIFDAGECLVVWNGAFAELHRDVAGRAGIAEQHLASAGQANRFCVIGE